MTQQNRANKNGDKSRNNKKEQCNQVGTNQTKNQGTRSKSPGQRAETGNEALTDPLPESKPDDSPIRYSRAVLMIQSGGQFAIFGDLVSQSCRCEER